MLVKLKLLLILRRSRPAKHVFRFVEGELDRFLRRHGFYIMSYEVSEVRNA